MASRSVGKNIRILSPLLVIRLVHIVWAFSRVAEARAQVTNQTLGAATHYPPSLQGTTNFPPDGILGMAFPSISVFNSSPVFQTIVSQHKVSDQVFGFFLASPGPELMIGGVNTELYSEPITWFDTEQVRLPTNLFLLC
jgi:hypothetical protein